MGGIPPELQLPVAQQRQPGQLQHRGKAENTAVGLGPEAGGQSSSLCCAAGPLPLAPLLPLPPPFAEQGSAPQLLNSAPLPLQVFVWKTLLQVAVEEFRPLVALGGTLRQLQHPAVFSPQIPQLLVELPQQPGSGLGGSGALTVAGKVTTQGQTSGFQGKIVGYQLRAVDLAVEGFPTAKVAIFFTFWSLQQYLKGSHRF